MAILFQFSNFGFDDRQYISHSFADGYDLSIQHKLIIKFSKFALGNSLYII
jgi:hypothetical protein